MEQTYFPDKSKFKDSGGRYLTQSLFLEYGYDTKYAIYTLADEDKEYEGVTYPSLKRLYLLTADPTGYTFANTYLYNFDHWERICANKAMYAEIEKWERELEVLLRSRAIAQIMSLGYDSFQAAKWAADGHWNVKRGRPSKAEQARERAIREDAVRDLEGDAGRIMHLIPGGKKNG